MTVPPIYFSYVYHISSHKKDTCIVLLTHELCQYCQSMMGWKIKLCTVHLFFECHIFSSKFIPINSTNVTITLVAVLQSRQKIGGLPTVPGKPPILLQY